MKHSYRILVALLAFMMLAGTWGAVAQTKPGHREDDGIALTAGSEAIDGIVDEAAPIEVDAPRLDAQAVPEGADPQRQNDGESIVEEEVDEDYGKGEDPGDGGDDEEDDDEGNEEPDRSPALYAYDAAFESDDDYYNHSEKIIDTNLNVGDTLQLVAIYLNGLTVNWFSDDEEVATVENGLITARKEGECFIYADLSDDTTLECEVFVADPAELSETELTMDICTKTTLTVSHLAGRSVTWKSSVDKVANVQKNGVVQALLLGTTTITAQIDNGKTLTCVVTVRDPSTISTTLLHIAAGHSEKLKVSNTSGRSVTWSTSDKKIARVSKGKVTAIKKGKVQIKAKVKNGVTHYCRVLIEEQAKISKKSLNLKVGSTATLKVTRCGNRIVTWTSNRSSIARVNKTGKVTAVKAGTCKITATLTGGTSFTCDVTVR